jgi:acyl-CoA thioester hydrolase
MQTVFRHRIRIYYEDTDHSGVVYHANYLKYFERAREHVIGPEALVALLAEHGIGFAVYKAEVTYKRGVRFGDIIEVRTRVKKSSEYRLHFQQDIHYPDQKELLVQGRIDLVCIDTEGTLVALPEHIVTALESATDHDAQL